MAMQQPADFSSSFNYDVNYLEQAGHILRMLGVALGIVIALVVFLTLIYVVFRLIFHAYFRTKSEFDAKNRPRL